MRMELIVSGYAAVFHNQGDAGTEYELAPGVFERIAPTAFDRCLRDRQDITATVAHSDRFELGNVADGTLRLAVDQRGLAFQLLIPETPVGAHIWKLVRARELRHCSMRFEIRDARELRAHGYRILELLAIDLDHIALTKRPAYTATTVRAGRLAGFSTRPNTQPAIVGARL